MVTSNKQKVRGKRKQTIAKEDNRTQTPRYFRSREDRLNMRFYEPLVLLHVLDRNGQQQISHCPSEDLVATQIQLRELRRTFLGQLAYVCDYKKGGDTVTAMALEARPSGVTFWVASNNDLSATTISFLRGIMKTLQSLATCAPEQRVPIEDDIARRSIEFSLKRIKAYQSLMQGPLQQCLANLKSSEEPEGV
jgi:hypothetical protein